MKTKKIRSISVSEIGMGCMGFSHGYGQVPDAGYAEEAIREAFGYGCNFFDTAEGYGKDLYYPGHNEEIVGRAVKGIRNDVVIATKLHIQPETVKDCGSVYAAVRRHLECSLKNLQTDHVDLYICPCRYAGSVANRTRGIAVFRWQEDSRTDERHRKRSTFIGASTPNFIC